MFNTYVLTCQVFFSRSNIFVRIFPTKIEGILSYSKSIMENNSKWNGGLTFLAKLYNNIDTECYLGKGGPLKHTA